MTRIEVIKVAAMAVAAFDIADDMALGGGEGGEGEVVIGMSSKRSCRG